MENEPELEKWQADFTKLSHKLGRKAWGASVEGDGMGSLRMRVYLETDEAEELVMKETGGVFLGYPLVFTTFKYEDYLEHLKIREEKYENAEREKEDNKP